jgi:ribA/ribD-fused uncharacterized protein
VSTPTTAPGTVDELLAALDSGARVRYLLFWGHQPQRDGGVGPGCLSQWWPAGFTVQGVMYRTAEHWMMVGKARLFGDDAIAERILASEDPGAAKALGRKVRAFDQQVWEQHRFDLVVAGSMAKFEQNPPLADFLRATGTRVLVEASPVDRIWGIGLAANDPRAEDPAQWRGLNLLGFALMRARAKLSPAA